MTEVCTTTPGTASPELAMRHLKTYLTVNEAAGLLRRKPWPIVTAIKAGELRASMPSNDGCWLIRPEDLTAYVERFANEVTGGSLSREEQNRISAERAKDAAWERRQDAAYARERKAQEKAKAKAVRA